MVISSSIRLEETTYEHESMTIFSTRTVIASYTDVSFGEACHVVNLYRHMTDSYIKDTGPGEDPDRTPEATSVACLLPLRRATHRPGRTRCSGIRQASRLHLTCQTTSRGETPSQISGVALRDRGATWRNDRIQ